MPRGRKGSRVTALRKKTELQPVTYLDDLDIDSDEEGFKQNFNIQEKLASTKFQQNLQFFVKELSGEKVSFLYFQQTGFDTPILVIVCIHLK